MNKEQLIQRVNLGLEKEELIRKWLNNEVGHEEYVFLKNMIDSQIDDLVNGPCY